MHVRSLLIGLVFGVLFGGATHFIVYRWALDAFPRLRRWRKRIVLGIAAVILLQSITRWLTIRWHWQLAADLQVVAMIELLTVAIASIPIAVMRMVGWLVERLGRDRATDASAPPEAREDARAKDEPAPSVPLTRRQAVERIGGLAFLGTTGSMLGWGVVRGRHAFQIDELVVRIPGLPRALDGYTIAQISDIHCGAFIQEKELDEGLSRVREVRADLLVVTGDLVDFDPSYAPLVARKIADAAPRDGAFAVVGNHDHYTGAAAVLDALRAAKVRALYNEGVRVREGDGGGFALLGLDDIWGARSGGPGPMLSRAAAMVEGDAPRILLSHNPATIELWSVKKVALQLSGHTHGGQLNPGFRPADLLMRYVSGRYDVQGTTLYVNRGFGTVGPPSRVGAPPEVTRVVLVAA